jgi:hypothetical protein
MGVNWDSGVLFWQDHAPSANERYTLSHLHPFVQRIELAATEQESSAQSKTICCVWTPHVQPRNRAGRRTSRPLSRQPRSAHLLPY